MGPRVLDGLSGGAQGMSTNSPHPACPRGDGSPYKRNGLEDSLRLIQALGATKETDMQTRNKFFDDMSQLMTNAMGVAQGAKTEAETAMSSMVDRWLASRDFVTREEFDAVRAMAQKAREENEALSARLAALEGKSK